MGPALSLAAVALIVGACGHYTQAGSTLQSTTQHYTDSGLRNSDQASAR